MMNTYYYKARLFPTILTCLPLCIFANLIIYRYFHSSLESIFTFLPIFTAIGLSSAIIFLLVQVNRFIAKETIQKYYFRQEDNMPTTNYLLYEDLEYDDFTKNLIRQRIMERFNISLPSHQEELSDVYAAKRIIKFAVSQVRNSLRESKLLLQHNIEYGFFRNLLGGCIQASLFSLLIILYAHIENMEKLFKGGIILLVIYTAFLAVSKKIMNTYGKNYAKILFEEFVSLNS